MHYAPAAATTLTGDYVGVESCIDLRNEEDFDAYERECEKSYERRKAEVVRKAEAEAVGDRRRREEREVRKFPPPITSLARTENQPSHMPWVMRRYYTADGRLVIREEKVRRHEYFRAFRADGRLTLQLIPMDGSDDDVDVEDGGSVVVDDDVDVQSCTDVVVDDAVKEGEDGEEEEEKDEEKEEAVDDEMIAKQVAGDEAVMPAAPVMVSSMSMSALCITEGVNGGGGGRGMLASASFSSLSPSGGGGGGGGGAQKCYGFNSLRSSSASCLFHLQVPAIRPVII